MAPAVFISYARNDDLKPALENAPNGWVTFFWQQLRVALTDGGLPDAKLWLDRFEIDPAEEFTPKIQAALAEARLLIPVLSENWVQREWCQNELSAFCAKQPGANDNIVLVVKNEPRSRPRPGPLQGREGYRFFEREPSGGVREFYWMGLQDQKAYFTVLKEIATWIADRLLEAPPPLPTNIPTPKNRTVFAAVAADELGDARQRLVNDLTAAGYSVVPQRDRLPDTLAAAEQEIAGALADAELAVLLLGEQGGMKPDGSEEAIVPLQLRLARSRGLPRVLWAPKWLPASPDVKRDPFAVVTRFGDRQDGEEVYGEEVTDLSQWLRGRLGQRDERPPALPTVLIAAAASEDDELALTLAGRLPDDDVRPLWAGDPVPSDLRRPHVVIPWGAAPRASLEVLLAAVSGSAASVTVLRLPGGDAAAKGRFFAKGVYVEPLPALPDGRRAARDLLVRLEILEPAR